MIAAIHQPCYIPWLGYFHKIAGCDLFVFLDSVQYAKNSLTNRNRVKTASGWCWLTVPVQRKSLTDTKICEVEVSNATDWGERHWRTLKQNYAKAEHFDEYRSFFQEALSTRWVHLAELNKYMIRGVCSLLGLEARFVDSSSLDAQGEKTELLVNICREVGADTYLSGRGAKGYMVEERFREAGIALKYQDFVHPEYRQLYGPFIPSLSIVDMLFNEGNSYATPNR